MVVAEDIVRISEILRVSKIASYSEREYVVRKQTKTTTNKKKSFMQNLNIEVKGNVKK